MSIVTVCLGSNISSEGLRVNRASVQLGKALRFIEKHCVVLKDSGAYPSDPEKSAIYPYLNRVLILGTELGYDELHALFKEYESRERASLHEPGRVTIDIDIVMVGTEVVRPLDYNSAYFRKGIESLK